MGEKVTFASVAEAFQSPLEDHGASDPKGQESKLIQWCCVEPPALERVQLYVVYLVRDFPASSFTWVFETLARVYSVQITIYPDFDSLPKDGGYNLLVICHGGDEDSPEEKRLVFCF